jgi:DNA-binding response OmpR family regulator
MAGFDAAGTSEAGISVLLVEDDQDLNRGLSLGLRREGLNVVSALTAAEGLKIVADPDVAVDVLVMDLHLPDSWGAYAAMENRRIRPDLPVIFISGAILGDPVLASTATEASGVTFLAKPFPLSSLLEEIRRAVSKVTP